MTSFLEVIAHEDDGSALNVRKATVTAKTRIDQRFGSFLHAASSSEDYRARVHHIGEDVRGILSATLEEFGVPSSQQSNIGQAILAGYIKPPQPKEASVHESRKPKMCPFHKDVVDISLNAGDPSAGFNSMAQHWGGPRHCEGDGYEGDNCNFKPQMTTQSYWDEKAEKAEQRKKDRAEQAELEAQQSEEIDTSGEQEESVEDHAPDSEPVDALEHTNETPEADGAEVIPFPQQDAAEPVAEAPMSMAASTKTADGGPVPKMDKRKWTPQTVKEIDVDDADGPNPTKRKDIVEVVRADNSGDLEEIGEHRTERQDVTEKGGPTKGDGTQTWTDGPNTAVSATIPHDVDKNPIKALMAGEYDGFLPQNTVQQAIAAHKRR